MLTFVLKMSHTMHMSGFASILGVRCILEGLIVIPYDFKSIRCENLFFCIIPGVLSPILVWFGLVCVV